MDSLTSKTWELNSYELQRSPQKVLSDSTVISICPRSLQSELMCPICLDILKTTMTTKECLHRFCAECIVTALRSGNKECPTCRKKLISKRSLRQDPNFDAIIAKIFPCREEYEAHQEKVLAKLNKQHLSAALTLSLEASSFKQRLRANKNQNDASEDESIDSRRSSHKNSIDQDTLESKNAKNTPTSTEIDILLRPQTSSPPVNTTEDDQLSLHSADNKSTVKYLKAPAIATINHLSEYLSMRAELETTPNSLQHGNNNSKELVDQVFKISILNEATSQFEGLSGSLTLEEVVKMQPSYNITQTNLVLYYQKINQSS